MEEFAGLNVGDTVNFVHNMIANKVKVTKLDDNIITIEGGRTFNRSTGYACNGAIVFIQRIK